AAAQILRLPSRRYGITCGTVLLRAENPDGIALARQHSCECREIFERPAFCRSVLRARHHGNNRTVCRELQPFNDFPLVRLRDPERRLRHWWHRFGRLEA